MAKANNYSSANVPLEARSAQRTLGINLWTADKWVKLFLFVCFVFVPAVAACSRWNVLIIVTGKLICARNGRSAETQRVDALRYCFWARVVCSADIQLHFFLFLDAGWIQSWGRVLLWILCWAKTIFIIYIKIRSRSRCFFINKTSVCIIGFNSDCLTSELGDDGCFNPEADWTLKDSESNFHLPV